MINNEDFIKRLEKVMDYFGESASSFSEKIGVQRSSISHIISGRNKPSLDFVLKVLTAYPEIELYWLLNGKGSFPSDLTEKKKEIIISKEPISELVQQEKKKIDRIVIFYSDGSFENFEQQ